MLWLIVRHQMLDHLQSFRFAIACVICVVLFPVSASVLLGHVSDARATYEHNRDEHHKEVMERTSTWDALRPWKADRPVNAMRTLVTGVNAPLTETVDQGGSDGPTSMVDLVPDALRSMLMPVDFTFTVGVVLSLIVLVFSHDTIAGERESERLRLLMSYRLPRHRLLLAKWLGGYLPVAATFLLGLCPALAILATGDVGFDRNQVANVVGLVVVALLYLAAVNSLGLLVSCLTGRSSTAIAILLLLWATAVLSWPKAAPYMATILHPVASIDSVEREIAELKIAGRQRRQAEVFGGASELTGVATDTQKALLREIERQTSRRIESVRQNHASAVAAQTALGETLTRLSPFSSFQLAATALAATGAHQELRFAERLREYHTTWQAYSQQKVKPLDTIGTKRDDPAYADEYERLKVTDFHDYPRFGFRYMPLSERLENAALDVVLLAMWSIALFLAAHASFLRQEIG
jgi:ABC-type transport system involved in multi-copper enzyme maturation permease subunit